MKARLLKRLLDDTPYIVHDKPDFICVGSAYANSLIRVGKKSLQLYYGRETLKSGREDIHLKELLEVWDGLALLIASGEIQDIIDGDDDLVNPLPVYTYGDNYEIISSFTDQYGWPNTDITGKLMYDNMWFPAREAAIYKARQSCDDHIKYYEEAIIEKRISLQELECRMEDTKAAKLRLEK